MRAIPEVAERVPRRDDRLRVAAVVPRAREEGLVAEALGLKLERERAPGKAVEKIFLCVAEGLPSGWRQVRVVITEMSSAGKERSFEGRFEYSTDNEWAKPVPLKPCDPREVAQGVYELNEYLAPERRAWKVATLTFTDEGKFEIKYDYVK